MTGGGERVRRLVGALLLTALERIAGCEAHPIQVEVTWRTQHQCLRAFVRHPASANIPVNCTNVRSTTAGAESAPMSDEVWARMFACAAGTRVDDSDDDDAAKRDVADDTDASVAALRTQQVKEGRRHAEALQDWLTDPRPTAAAMERFARVSSDRPVRHLAAAFVLPLSLGPPP